MNTLLLVMLVAPLAGSIINGLVLRSPSAKLAGLVASASAATAFACAVTLWLSVVGDGEAVAWSVPWMSAGELTIQWGFRFDALTAVMALVVTGIGTLIHVYSIGYMSEEPNPYRYFAYLNLFLASMLILIAGDSLPVVFVGWEGVGLCSYLLIGYWYTDPEKAYAGIKAFVLNRIGDAGFLLGIFLCFTLFQTLEFEGMRQAFAKIAPGQVDLKIASLAGLCLFIGAMGKSAQIPLYVWLPDAMAGPTPVSALIHAATMVTAGVYLLTRMNFLFELIPEVRLFVAWIGVSTALLAATIALVQRDIKKVLAYSTVSQLGLMFVAIGTSNYVAAIFHLFTHAFFKALLFLGAGSVIHGLHGEQDIFNMGGLRSKMPSTFWTFTIATAAICGLPPLSGFFSKDAILYGALIAERDGQILWLLASAASLMTAFYMTRLYVVVFFGEYRGHAHAHESPSVMTLPLWILAIGSAVAGLLGFPHDLHLLPDYLAHFVAQVVPSHHAAGGGHLSELEAMAVATLLACVGVGSALFLYLPNLNKSAVVAKMLRPFHWVLERKYFVDEVYDWVFVKPFKWSSLFLWKFVDVKIVDGAVLLPPRLARTGARALSAIQVGSVQFYLLVMVLGSIVTLWFSLKGLR